MKPRFRVIPRVPGEAERPLSRAADRDASCGRTGDVCVWANRAIRVPVCKGSVSVESSGGELEIVSGTVFGAETGRRDPRCEELAGV